MNDRQRIVLAITAAVAGVMLLFPPARIEAFHPPWMNTGDEEIVAVSEPVRYLFILHEHFSHDDKGAYLSMGLHWPRLRFQLMILVLVAIVMLGILRGGKGDNNTDDGGGDGHAPDDTPPDLPRPHVDTSAPGQRRIAAPARLVNLCLANPL